MAAFPSDLLRDADAVTNLFKIVSLYEGMSGLPGTNTLYAAEGDVAIHDMRVELDTFYSALCDDFLTNELTVTVPSTGDIIDSADGSLIGVWNDGTPLANTGTLTQGILPLATQLLVQLQTNEIVAGRKLHGRLFIPGFTDPSDDNGMVAADTLSAVHALASTAFSDDAAVYSPTHHTWATVADATVWSQWAVLRSRRT